MFIRTLIISLTLFIVNLSAQTLDAKIAKLNSVPKEQRYILINSIKRDLAKLNREQRLKAIAALKEKLNKKHKNMHKNRGNKAFKSGLKYKNGILHLHKRKHKRKNRENRVKQNRPNS